MNNHVNISATTCSTGRWLCDSYCTHAHCMTFTRVTAKLRRSKEQRKICFHYGHTTTWQAYRIAHKLLLTIAKIEYIIVLQGRYHNISNTIATNSKYAEIMLFATNSTRIIKCNVINDANFGIWIGSSTSTSLMNVSAEDNQYGIKIDSSTCTSLMHVSAEHNQ